jgi:hypothetical protein
MKPDKCKAKPVKYGLVCSNFYEGVCPRKKGFIISGLAHQEAATVTY